MPNRRIGNEYVRRYSGLAAATSAPDPLPTLGAHSMIKKALVALAITGTMASAQAGYLVKEHFNNVSDLTSKGWVLNNASTPSGATGWFQGDQQQFSSFDGAPNSYVAANYGSAADGGIINNWLITPEFSLSEGVVVSFWLRAAEAAGFSDEVSFGFSDGSSALSAFDMSAPITVSSDGWALYKTRIEKGAVAGNARFAVQYTGSYDSSNYIGLDRFAVSQIPEPSSILMLGAGVMGLIAARRRKRG